MLSNNSFNAYPANRSRPAWKQARLAAIFLAMATLWHGAWAQSQFEKDFDDQEKPWQEIAVQFPSAPNNENLLPFYVSPTATQSFAIDAHSVSVGTDGVIRYTLVARSEEGATNISYEGVRCQSFEKKLYAFGRPDGSWSRSRRNQWEPIPTKVANRQHAALALDYFCQGNTVAGKAEDIVKRIRYKQPLSEQR
ncbi:CNP1-like family protein [Noviherbaspirillum massiliense]|uniref:CNP1-like family protein n=1 Tax=Noviherbaspirillum massiliense TaxID=1465823 RepID=UPI00031B91AA|nr:CNP1-like family protein [Noviherbaspirillum massiliense]